MDTERLYKQLDKNDQWIQNADLKLSIILTFIGVLGGYIIVKENLQPMIKIENEWVHLGIASSFIIASVCLVIGIFCSANGLQASVKNSKRGLWFFGDVAHYKEWYFFKTAKKNQSDEEFEEDLVNQIHTTAKIAIYKFSWFNRAVFWSKGTLFFYLIYYILKFLNLSL